MLTALEIQNKEFTRGLHGYKEEEVDQFLDEIITLVQNLTEENEALKGKIAEYKSTEGSVLTTLESAKALLADISKSAEKRAAIVIRNAEIEAEGITKSAKDEISSLNEEISSLKVKAAAYKAQYKALLEQQLNSLDFSEAQVFGED